MVILAEGPCYCIFQILAYVLLKHVLYSFVDGYLGYFRILIIVIDAAVNIGGHVSTEIRLWKIFSDIYQGGELQNHIIALF